MTAIHHRSALALGRMLRARKISARELLEHCWQRYEAHNPALNAVIVTDIEGARRAAAESDNRLGLGEARSRFDGVPMTAKESFDWTGTPSTWGAPAYKDNIAKSDAVALKRLTDAGVIVYGKTNVPFMLADWQSFNAIYGTTANPWDPARSPGGSSGGSAVALATGMSAMEIGSDIGASIRNPAHYCGVFGHKPTFGIVPMTGHMLPGVAHPSDISCAGPLARSAGDLAAMLKLMAGPEAIEARAQAFRLAAPRRKALKDFRVAVMLDDPVSEVDRPLQDLIAALARHLESRVARLSYEARPEFSTQEAFDIYIALLRAATSRRQTEAEFAANAEKVQGFAEGDTSYLAKMLSAYVMPHRSWLAVNNRRHEMRLLWERFFEDWDVFLCPTAASAAYPHDHEGERHERTVAVNGRRVAATDQLFWAGYTCCFYLPSTVAPIGLTKQKLPGGIQIAARQHDDLTAIRFAELLEREGFAFAAPPEFA